MQLNSVVKIKFLLLLLYPSFFRFSPSFIPAHRWDTIVRGIIRRFHVETQVCHEGLRCIHARYMYSRAGTCIQPVDLFSHAIAAVLLSPPRSCFRYISNLSSLSSFSPELLNGPLTEFLNVSPIPAQLVQSLAIDFDTHISTNTPETSKLAPVWNIEEYKLEDLRESNRTSACSDDIRCLFFMYTKYMLGNTFIDTSEHGGRAICMSMGNMVFLLNGTARTQTFRS